MSDDFEDLLKRWLRDRAGHDRSALQALAGNVAALPPRRRRGLSPLASAAVILVSLALGTFILAPRLGSVGGSPEGTPTNGEAATWNLELARCGASLATALAVFPMEHARDYRLHLPAMLLSPELDVDDPAFVVVYGEMQPFGGGGAAPAPGQTWAPRSLDPGHHDLCVLVGADAATAELNVYGNVDTTGMRAAVESTEPFGSSGPSTEPATGGSTSEPGPAWAGDPATALECDGPPASIGPGPFASSPAAPDAGLAIDLWLARTHDLVVVFPRAGFSVLEASGSWQLHGVRAGGRTRAVIVLEQASDGGGWSVVGVASCDPSEFDAFTPLGVEITIWSGPAGSTVPTTRIREVADCYGGTQLTVDGRLYVWDPTGGESGAYDPAALEGTFSTTLFVPSSATLTAFREGARQLYLAPDGSAVYVETPDSVQRWPHVIGDEVVRTDCN
jgi:hypothetical protein